MKTNKFLLQMKNINKSFNGVSALKNINLNVKKASVHALMGENGAGKSTLMKILLGVYKMDSGEIFFNGKILNQKYNSTLNKDIAMVHQELKPILENDIAENIFCGRYPTKKLGFLNIINFNKMYEDTSNLLKQVNLNLDPKTKLKNLSISQIQIIEILKAISTNAKLIILDEPTSSLTDDECAILFSIIKNLQKEGISFIYISHKIDEILKISDQVSVLRDGQYIGTWDSNTLTTELIIKYMVGRELTNRFPVKENRSGNTILKITNFSSDEFNNINFELKENEILGISGLVGAKRTELVETIFGVRKFKKGEILFNSKTIIHNTPHDAIKNNFALLTEDRRKTGIFASLSVSENIGIISINNYLDHKSFINYNKMQIAVNNTINKLNIKMTDSKMPIEYLSGGNQQKALLGRWLLNTPRILILDEPTRGIDVATKYEIYCLISDLAKNGKSIIFISSEMPELLGISDRILVMCNGKITGELDSKSATQEKIMNLATKF